MAKLVVVTREQQEMGRADLERQQAHDPRHQEETREIAEEKSRRDSEHLARKTEGSDLARLHMARR